MNLGEWIIGKYKTQAAFAEKLNVRQGQVSRWISGANEVSEGYRREIRNLGYKGPWPEKTAAKGENLVTREEFAEEKGALRAEVRLLRESLEKAFELIRDLKIELTEVSRPREP
jgi:transcriptional regulator with XRE-family HTH domain